MSLKILKEIFWPNRDWEKRILEEQTCILCDGKFNRYAMYTDSACKGCMERGFMWAARKAKDEEKAYPHTDEILIS